jgi:hypothetical protein
MGLCRTNHNNIKNQCLAVLFTLLPGMVFSTTADSSDSLEDERWFQIELIIFAHNDKDALESEDWPNNSDLTLPDELVELSFPAPKAIEEKPDLPATKESTLIFEPVDPSAGDSPTTEPGEAATKPVPMPVAFEMLPEEELQLNDAAKKLTRSSRFEPLLHIAWRQPTFDKDKAQPVLLYEGMTKPVSEITAGKETSRTDYEEDASIGPQIPRLVGTVRLSVARYLHLAADLVYRIPVNEQVAIPLSDLQLWDDKPYLTLSQHQGPAYQLKQWKMIRGFRLKESRRMRSKKIHYLDHPFFGVVVLVTPVELPKEPEAESIPDPLRNISPQGN